MFARLFRPVDIASLAVFRMLFGALMTVAVARYFVHGWIDTFYAQPRMYFPYSGFAWMRPLPQPGMYLLFALIGLAALCLAIGYRARLAAALFCLGFTYVHLIDKTNYLNHYYLISLVSGLLTVMPVGGALSIDAWRDPQKRKRTIPAWMPNVLRFQVGIVYLFAGLAKIDADWLLAAEPLRIWLSGASDVPWLGSVLQLTSVAYAFSWAGMLFDLTIPVWLSWRRTRVAAYIAVIGFHAITGWLFPIGLFPVVMIAFTTVFFAPDWPRRWLPNTMTGAAAEPPCKRPRRQRRGPVLAFLAVWGLVQLIVPLRFLAWPGCVNWTEDGFRFAWRVMLIEKYAVTTFRLVDRRTGGVTRVDPADLLTAQQARMMSTQPDMLLHFAHRLAERARARGEEVAVYADVRLAFNGRPSRVFVDPSVDLATIPASTPTANWLASPCPPG